MLDLLPKQRIQIIEHLYTKLDISPDVVLQSKEIYRIYVASIAAGNKPILILSKPNKNLPLGENEITLKRLDNSEASEFFERYGKPTGYALKKLSKFGFSFVKDEKTKKIDKKKTWQNFLKDFDFYQPTLSLRKSDMEKIIENPSFLLQQLELYLTEGCQKDKRILLWAKSCVPVIGNDYDEFWLCKYRGHALVIKPPKTGFTTFGEKVGQCVTWSSSSSIRGYADAKGNVYPGISHGNFGSIMLDEAARYKEVILDVALNMLEQGKMEVLAAGRRLINLGAPKITIVMNPGGANRITQDSDYLYLLDLLLPKITSVPEAIGSRFGLILINRNLQPVIEENILNQEQIAKNKLLIDSLREMLAPKVAEIYLNQEVQKWLSQPLNKYKEQIMSLVQGLDDILGKRMKVFWIDHATSAYRHVRGCAFECAIFDSFIDIIQYFLDAKSFDDIFFSTLFERAEANLDMVISFNLESLYDMINLKESVKDNFNQIILDRYVHLREEYLKPLVFITAVILKSENITNLPINILGEKINYYYSLIDTQKRTELFGSKYGSGFSQILHSIERLSPEKLKRAQNLLLNQFGITFDLDLSNGGLKLVVYENLLQNFDFEKLHVNLPNLPNLPLPRGI
ncbi:MAG: hypothetical protein QXM68_02130 [Candidatus Aenigmatarchaeota archaeon]|nr:hypothetical protein [Candidatus Aenigmarchaeota archaeon]